MLPLVAAAATGRLRRNIMVAPRAYRQLWIAWLVILAAATTITYANSAAPIFGGLDAKQSIRDNPYITRLWPLSDAMSFPLLADTMAGDAGGKGGSVARRPILSLSFALTIAIFGPSPLGFHLVNIAIHLLTGLLLFDTLSRRIAGVRPPPAWPAPSHLAGMTCLIWLLHPLQTESVTYVVQRAESLCGFFGMVTIWSWDRWSTGLSGRHRWLALSVSACAMGMATKETMVVVPVLVLLYDGTFLSRNIVQAIRDRRPGYLWLFSTWLVLVALLVATWTDVHRDFDEGRNLWYAMHQPYVIGCYLFKLFWPRDLFVYLNTRQFDHVPAWQLTCAAIALAATAVTTIRAIRRGHWSGFVGAWFFLWLAPSSSVVATSDVIQEHRIYMASAAPCLLFVLGINGLTTLAKPKYANRVAQASLVLIAILLGGRTWQRNLYYRGEFSPIHPADIHEAYTILLSHYLTQPNLDHAVAEARIQLKNGDSPRDASFAHLVLAIAAARAGDEDTADEHYIELLERNPDYAQGHLYYAQFARSRGRWEDAIQQLHRARDLDPTSTAILRELGITLTGAGRYAEARAALQACVEAHAESATAINNLAYLEASDGNPELAEALYQKALQLDPESLLALTNLADLYRDENELAAAAATYERILALYPRATYSRLQLIDIHRMEGKPELALRMARELVNIEPGDATHHLALASSLRDTGDLDGAGRELRKTIELAPENVVANLALGVMLAKAGELQAAETYLDTAIRIDPTNAEGTFNLAVLHARQGRTRTAANYFREAQRLDPDLPLLSFNLALLALDQGEPERAKELLERQLRQTPGHEPSMEALRRLAALPTESPEVKAVHSP